MTKNRKGKWEKMEMLFIYFAYKICAKYFNSYKGFTFDRYEEIAHYFIMFW